MFTSKFRFYSVGIAATNKKRNSMEIEVCPIEVVNLIDGDIVPNVVDLISKGKDGEEKDYTVSISAANTVTAMWLQFGSNRKTAPDIRRGERVLLFRYADSDIFYWVSLGMDDDLRRLETVVYAFSNTRDESVKQLTPDNSYYFEVSTHDKHITLQTNKSDGEPFAYTIQVNTKDGRITITDDDGNFIFLDSAERDIRLENKDKTFVDLNKKNLFINAPKLIRMTCEDWEVEASKSISFKTKKWDSIASNSTTLKTTNWSVNASASIDFQTAAWSATATTSITYTSPTFTGTIPASTFTGMVGVAGMFTAAGGLGIAPSLGAPPTITGDAASGMSMSVGFELTGTAVLEVATTGDILHGTTSVGALHNHPNPEGGNTGPVNPLP